MPVGLSVDDAGNVYISTAGDHRVKKYSSDGTLLARYGMLGHGEGEIYVPEQIAVDTNGLVYLSDSGNNRIQVFRKMGQPQPPSATIDQADPIMLPPGGGLVYLRGSGSSDNIADTTFHYEWLLDGVRFGGDNSMPIVSVSGPGNHEIRLRVQNTSGFSSWQVVHVTVQEQHPKTSWTMLLYLDGDNNGTTALHQVQSKLEQTFEQMPNDQVQIMLLYDGPDNGDSKLYQQQGTEFHEVEDTNLNGEVDMGDEQTLVNFVRAGVQNAPADHYYLAIADHANGLDGIAWTAIRKTISWTMASF